MTRIYMAAGDAFAVIEGREGRWRASLTLQGLHTTCVEVDPLKPERVYCGTFGRGLWVSDDQGAGWRQAGEGITHAEVTAVAASAAERCAGYGTVWVGTEPSAIFRSEDGGNSWVERRSLQDLPSKPTWSFPPRPWTHHVRWIAPDPLVPERLFVGIELGGVMRSLDGGRTWEDRKPEAQPDAHHLRTHPLAPGSVYETAGGGYAESLDGGATWRRDDAGMRHHYLWGLAVDPADPDTVLVSASRGPMSAHRREAAEATMYRKVAGQPWTEVRDGLPQAEGTRVYGLASNPDEPGVFYAATHEGAVYRSGDSGLTWHALDVDWPQGTLIDSQMPVALAVIGAGQG